MSESKTLKVFSWGDGVCGALGHPHLDTDRECPLPREVKLDNIIQVAAGTDIGLLPLITL